MLSDGYNAEQRTIADQIPILQKQIEDLKASSTNVERFVTISNKYTDLQDLTPEILRTFIDKIVIHERTENGRKQQNNRSISTFDTLDALLPILQIKAKGKDGQPKLSVLLQDTASRKISL